MLCYSEHFLHWIRVLFIYFVESLIKPPKFSEVSTRAKTMLKIASVLSNKTQSGSWYLFLSLMSFTIQWHKVQMREELMLHLKG